MTLIVNLFGGPGVGKSTTAALTFANLKQAGVNTEIAHEYAKDLTWEDRHKAIRFQPYVTAKQIWRVHRLIGQVDVVITDSPILLALIYKGEGFTPRFTDYVVDQFFRWKNMNYLLARRDYKYQCTGRSQTEEQAKEIDVRIQAMLDSVKASYNIVEDGGRAAETITADVIKCLQERS